MTDNEANARALLAAQCPECGGSSGYMVPGDDCGGRWNNCGTCRDNDRLHSVNQHQAIRAIQAALTAPPQEAQAALCSDCPPPDCGDEMRCTPCPRRNDEQVAQPTKTQASPVCYCSYSPGRRCAAHRVSPPPANAPAVAGEAVVLPRKLTMEMEIAWCEAWFSKRRCIDDAEMADCWEAMIAAAPAPVAAQGGAWALLDSLRERAGQAELHALEADSVGMCAATVQATDEHAKRIEAFADELEAALQQQQGPVVGDGAAARLDELASAVVAGHATGSEDVFMLHVNNLIAGVRALGHSQQGNTDTARLDYIERTFSGMTNRERYLPVQMIWGKGCNGRTLREACDKYMGRDEIAKCAR